MSKESEAAPKEGPPRPKRLLVSSVVRGSHGWVTLTVLDSVEDGVGIPEKTIRIYDANNVILPMFDLEKTDTNGTTTLDYELGERQEASLQFEVLGTSIKETLVLRRELRRL